MMSHLIGTACAVLLIGLSSGAAAQDDSVLRFDFPGMLVGVAEDEAGPTGATVFYFPEPVRAVVDVRGGAPGAVNTETLRLQQDNSFTNAVCFAGGSSHGLSAVTGVGNALKEHWTAKGQPTRIPDVTGAIIYDVGSRRLNMVTPDDELGKQAFQNAIAGEFPLGPRGAGRFAMQGWFFGTPQHSGQGGAFRQEGQTKVGVFTVVNSLGAVVDREGQVVRCGATGETDCGGIDEAYRDRLELSFGRAADLEAPVESEATGTTGNTTLTLVVTNEDLTAMELKRLAIQVHTSMGRAIQPFSTIDDGDVLIAASTSEVKTEGLKLTVLSALASEVAWDAVLASVPEIPYRELKDSAAWDDASLDEATGTYAFSPWYSLQIQRDGDRLVAHTPARSSLYFRADRRYLLRPIGPDVLQIDGPRGDRLQLERDAAGGITGLSLNPGRWAQRATRE